MADSANEDPKDFRQKLGATTNLAVDALAQAAIATEGLQHVTLEDAKGLEPDLASGGQNVAEHLRRINTERQALADKNLDTLLAQKGMTREQFDALQAQPAAQGAPPNQGGGGIPDQGQQAVNSIRGIQGEPPSGAPGPNLQGIENNGEAQMGAYFEHQAANAKR